MPRSHTTRWALATLALAALAPAQNCLTTTFAGNTSTSSGCAALFDLSVNSAIAITSIDGNFTAAASTLVGLQVWVTPNTYLGNQSNQAAWTQVANVQNVPAAGAGQPTTFTLTTPIVLQPGSYGVSLVSSANTSHRYTSGAATFSDSIMTLTLGAIHGTPWSTGALLTPRQWNGRICYTPTSGYATAVAYGQGCYERFASFYETFPNGTFDLSNTSLMLAYNGTGYTMVPVGTGWFTPLSANLGLTDDSVSGAQNLGFTLPYPGGSTTAVYVSSNGLVWGTPSTVNGCCAGTPATLLTNGPCWAPNWGDLNPAAGGTVHFDVDPSGQAAYVTFLNVPEYSTTNLNTFQVAFFASGTVEYRFQGCLQANRIALTGWSPGGGARDPGSIDLSATPTLTTRPDSTGLAMLSSARPVLGTAIQLVTGQVPAGALLGSTLLGLTEFTTGLDLSGLGMPGCRQYTSIDASAVWVPAGGSGSTPATFPNNPALAGVQIKAQGIALVPGANPVGVQSSNGLRLTLDVN
jgi:hypothetical protein